MHDFAEQRAQMVEAHIARRGIRNRDVLDAMRAVPREAFVPEELAEFAYEDAPLPIGKEQTISQPFIVAAMIEAAGVSPGDTVLEIGTGSGYAAAVLSRIAKHVVTIERHEELARTAKHRLEELGYDNVEIFAADGTLGWPDQAPYDAIVVAAGGKEPPPPLLEQLAIGGTLVIPVGETQRLQRLIRVVRTRDGFEEEDLGSVRFVPLIGAEGWPEPEAGPRPASRDEAVTALLRESVEPIDDIDSASIASLLDRIGNARVVLLGEATHGTSEFYRMRARITRELVLRKGFTMVAVEADWPDAAVYDRHIRHRPPSERRWQPFKRFPTWMWKNEETLDLIEWLREHNRGVPDPNRRVSFHGLDLYSLYNSAAEVIQYLQRVDPPTARVARERYGCLSPWQGDPAAYGRAALTGTFGRCEREVVAMLRELFERRLEYAAKDGEDFADAFQNARLVANAERYYRIMYYGSAASWNLRDEHMFETLLALLAFAGPESKAVVWEHNSHVGDARATEMSARGEHNVGSLCRAEFGDDAYIVGFGTDHGTVAAASDWDGPMLVQRVRPALRESYERLFHQAAIPAGLLHLKTPVRDSVREELAPPRLERAIGVVYRPDTELQSHYFQAILPRQFDSYVWFDETRAVSPLPGKREAGIPDTYPFGV